MVKLITSVFLLPKLKKQAHKIDVLIEVRICNQEKVMGKRAVLTLVLRQVAAHHGPSYVGPGPAFDYDEL